MSVNVVALYVVDAQTWGFRDACREHRLHKGQGATGRALLNQMPCFLGTRVHLMYFFTFFKIILWILFSLLCNLSQAPRLVTGKNYIFLEVIYVITNSAFEQQINASGIIM